MQSAETVLGVLRERGRRGLPLNELYRQLFNPELYFLAYGNIYSNKGAMTPGPDGETADGMSRGKIRVSCKVFCAGHEGLLRPRMARSRAVSCLILRMVAAILV